MVDMKAKPFYLSDEDCKWVEETIAGMTTEEKIGQLFFNMGSSRDEEYLKMTVDKYHIGGIRYNPATGAEPDSSGEQQDSAYHCVQHGEWRQRRLH